MAIGTTLSCLNNTSLVQTIYAQALRFDLAPVHHLTPPRKRRQYSPGRIPLAEKSTASGVWPGDATLNRILASGQSSSRVDVLCALVCGEFIPREHIHKQTLPCTKGPLWESTAQTLETAIDRPIRVSGDQNATIIAFSTI
jgi:hypothetical protein